MMQRQSPSRSSSSQRRPSSISICRVRALRRGWLSTVTTATCRLCRASRISIIRAPATSPVTAVEGRRGPPVNRPLPIVLRYRRRERWAYGEEQEMKAIRCREWGAPDVLRLEEAESPNLKQHQVRLRVRAAGVNFADSLMVGGTYQVKPPFPFIPGLEA